MDNILEFPLLLESPGIFIGKFPGPGKSWKMTLVFESPRNLLAGSWKVLNLLGSDADCSFWLQIDMFLHSQL